MKRVFVTYGAGALNGVALGSVNNVLELFLTVAIWDDDVVGILIFGGPSDPISVVLEISDDERDVEKKIKDKMIADYGVTKHDVVILG